MDKPPDRRIVEEKWDDDFVFDSKASDCQENNGDKLQSSKSNIQSHFRSKKKVTPNTLYSYDKLGQSAISSSRPLSSLSPKNTNKKLPTINQIPPNDRQASNDESDFDFDESTNSANVTFVEKNADTSLVDEASRNSNSEEEDDDKTINDGDEDDDWDDLMEDDDRHHHHHHQGSHDDQENDLGDYSDGDHHTQHHIANTSFAGLVGFNMENPFFELEGMNIGSGGIGGGGTAQRESLLEYLEAEVHKSILTDSSECSHVNRSKQALHEDDFTSMSEAASGSMMTTSPLRAYLVNEETRALEAANQHLKGLFGWIDSGTSTLKTVLTDANCSAECNARRLLVSEIHLIQRDDVYFVQRLLSRCEESPTSESCLYSLEVIIKWIRAICSAGCDEVLGSLRGGSVKSDARPSSGQLGRDVFGAATTSGKSINSNFFESGKRNYLTKAPAVTPAVDSGSDLWSGKLPEQLEVTVARCGVILSEQNKHGEGQVCDLVRTLEAELSRPFASTSVEPRQQQTATRVWSHDTGGHVDSLNGPQTPQRSRNVKNVSIVVDNSSQASPMSSPSSSSSSDSAGFCSVQAVVGQLFKLLANHVNVLRLQVHLLDIRIHLMRSGEGERIGPDRKAQQDSGPPTDSLYVDFNNLTAISSENMRSSGYLTTLAALRAVFDELGVVTDQWMRLLNKFLPAAALIADPSVQIGVEADLPMSLGTQCFGPTDELTKKVRQRLGLDLDGDRIVDQLKSEDHPYTQEHSEQLLRVIVDLQAMCATNALLLVCEMSPVSLQPKAPLSAILTTFDDPDPHSSAKSSVTLESTRVSPNTHRSLSNYFPHLGSSRKKDFHVDISSRSDTHPPRSRSQTATEDSRPPVYDVAFEASMGLMFIRLMTLIPSPSIARARLSFAAYSYLRKLKAEELPWQSVGKFRLIDSSEQLIVSVSSFTPDVVERAVLQSFAEAFGSLDESRILQLLLYEAAVDILPTQHIDSKQQQEDASRKKHHHRRGSSFHKNVFHLNSAGRKDGQQQSVRGIDREQSSDGDWDAPLETSTSERRVGSPVRSSLGDLFQHAPLSLNLGQSVFESIRHRAAKENVVKGDADLLSAQPAAETPPRHPPHSLKGYGSARFNSGAFTFASLGTPASCNSSIADDSFKSPSSHKPLTHKDSFFTKFIPNRSKNSSLSYSLRFELFTLCYEIFSHLGRSVADTSPTAALGLFKMCAIILAHLDRGVELHEHHRNAAILAVKLERHEASIMHGKYVLTNLLRGQSIAGGISGEGGDSDLSELMYVTELVTSEYCNNAQHELAIKTLFTTLHHINSKKQLGSGLPTVPFGSATDVGEKKHYSFMSGSGSTGKRTSVGHHRNETWSGEYINRDRLVYTQIEFERAVYPTLLRLGGVYLEMGRPAKAADTFQVLLLTLADRVDCIANDEKKVAVLSWVAECYLAMDDFDAAHRVLRAVKEVRKSKIDRVVTPVGVSTPTAVSTSSASNVSKIMVGIALPSPVFSPGGGGPVGPNSESRDLLARGKVSPRSQTPQSQVGATGRHFFEAPFSDVKQEEPRVLASPELTPQRGVRIATQKPLMVTPPNNVNLKYHLNSKESCLPKHCVTTYNTDLGDLIARVYFKNKQFVQALKSLTPTIIGVELIVGGKGAKELAINKEGLLELGKLYYLRGKIQLEASKSCACVKYPFDVGSAQLFAAIQLISSDVRRAKAVTASKKQFSRHHVATAPERQSGGRRNHNASCSSLSDKELLRTDSMHSSAEASHSRNFSVNSGARSGRHSSGPNNLLTCKRAVTYNNPSDLVWDAMRWFRRAWDLFHVAGDEVSAAKSANYIASCHLSPTFAPTAFFGASLEKACNLSTLIPESANDLSGTDWKELLQSAVSAGKRNMKVLNRANSQRSRPVSQHGGHAQSAKEKIDSVRPTSGGDAHDSAFTSIPLIIRHSSRSALSPAGESVVEDASLKQRPSSGKSSGSNTGQRRGPSLYPEHAADSPWNATTSNETSLKHRPLSTRSSSSVLFRELRDSKSGDGTVQFLSARSISNSSALFSNIRSVDSNDEQECRSPAPPPPPLQMVGRSNSSGPINVVDFRSSVGSGYRHNESLASISELVDSDGQKQKLHSSSSGTTVNTTSITTTGKNGSVVSRFASLEEVQRVMQFALEISLESCLPLVIIEAYVNLAELYVLQENRQDGLAYWWEARELFLHLYCDGALIPVLRVASLAFIQKLASVCSRMVRFLWTCDRVVINQNLFLLDSHLLVTNEVARVSKRMAALSKQTARSLDAIIHRFADVPTLRLPRSRQSVRTPGSSDGGERSVTDKINNTQKRIRSFLRTSSSDTIDADAAQQVLAPVAVEMLFCRHGFGTQLSDRDFFGIVSREAVADKLYDFSWRQYVDYHFSSTVGGVSIAPKSSSTPSSRDFPPPTISAQLSTSTLSAAEDLYQQHHQQASRSPSPSVGIGAGHRWSASGGSPSLTKQLLGTSFGWKEKSRVPLSRAPVPSVGASDEFSVSYGPLASAVVACFSRRKYEAVPEALRKYVVMRGDLMTDEEKGEGGSVCEEPMDSCDDDMTAETGVSLAAVPQSMASTGGLKNIANVSIVILRPNGEDNAGQPEDYQSTTSTGTSTYKIDRDNSHTRRGGVPFVEQQLQPLDPYADFAWMNESYSSYFTESLLHPDASRSSRSNCDPLVPEAFDSLTTGHRSLLSNANALANDSSDARRVFADLEARSESVMIQRVWRCYLLMRTAQRNYQSRKYSMDMLRHSIRSTLRNLSLFMYRLRAFSRQYKGKISVYDDLVSAVGVGCELNDHTDLTASLRNYIGATTSSSSGDVHGASLTPLGPNRDSVARRAVSLFHRMPHIAYAIHIDSLLMLYRPHDGAQNVQLFGGAGYLLYSTVEKPIAPVAPPSTRRSLSKSPRRQRRGEVAVVLTGTPRVNSFSLPSTAPQPATIPSATSFMLPYVSSSGEDTPGRCLSVEATQRHSPLGGVRSFSEEVGTPEGHLWRDIGTPTPTARGANKDTRPPLASGRFPFDRSLSSSAPADLSVDVTPAVTKQPVARKTSSGARSMGDDSLACSSSSGSSENLHGERKRTRNSADESNLSVGAVNELRTAASGGGAHRGLTHKIDSLMSMLSGSSFSRKSSTESVFHTAAATENKQAGYDSKSSSGSDLVGAPVVSPLPSLVTFEAPLDVSLRPEDVMLLFDLSVQDSSVTCAGGKKARQTQFESMAEGVLATSLAFLVTSSASSSECHEFHDLDASWTREHVERVATPLTADSTSSIFGRAASWQRRPGRNHSSSMSTLSTATGGSFLQGISGFSRASSSGDTDTTLVPAHSSRTTGLFGMFQQSTSDLMGSTHGSVDQAEQHNHTYCESPHKDRLPQPPMQPIPLTLLCSRGLQGVPWEMLLPNSRVVRGTSLLSLCAQSFSRKETRFVPPSNSVAEGPALRIHTSSTPTAAETMGRPPLATPKGSLRTSRFLRADSTQIPGLALQQTMKGHLGPGWNQRPVFVANASVEARFLQMRTELVATGELGRRARSALSNLSLLQHKSDALLRTNQQYKTLFGAQTISSMEYESAGSSESQVTYPVTSPLIMSTLRHRSGMLHQQSSNNHLDLTLLELYPASGPSSLAQHLQQVEARLAAMDASNQLDPDAGCAHFPVVLLSYSDLLEACDSMQYLATRRLDAVLVFAPHFVIESLAVEIKIALNRWCRPNIVGGARIERKQLKRPTSSGFLRGLKSVPSFLRMGGAAGVGELDVDVGEAHTESPDDNDVENGPGISLAGDIGNTDLDSPAFSLRRSLSSFSLSAGSGTAGAGRQDSVNKSTTSRSSCSHNRSFTDAVFGRAPSLPPMTPTTSSSFYSSSDSSTQDHLPTEGEDESASTTHRVGHNSAPRPRVHPPHPSQQSSSSGGVRSPILSTTPQSDRESIRAKDRTWVYHALLAVVQQVQQEHAVPIAVFI